MSEAEKWAKRGHELYEELAPAHGYATRKESAVAWEQVPANNRALMIEVYGKVIAEFKAEFVTRQIELGNM